MTRSYVRRVRAQRRCTDLRVPVDTGTEASIETPAIDNERERRYPLWSLAVFALSTLVIHQLAKRSTPTDCLTGRAK